MVSTSSPLAVAAGLWALGEGGNAVDAAIATDAVLGVTQPMWTGIGGDAFALVDDGQSVVAFNGSGAAPGALTLDLCTAAVPAATGAPPAGWPAGVEQIFADFPLGLPDTSALTVTVPGVVDTWVQLSERFGRLPLARLLEPAIDLAERGFPVGRQTARAWRSAAGRLRGGSLPVVVRSGERVANPELAATLRAIASGGRDAHYEGAWGAAVTRSVRSEGGVLAEADLAAHRGVWVAPVATTYRGYEVYEAPPNGQGAAVLAALNRLEREPPPLPDDPAGLARIVDAVRGGMREAHAHVADPRHAEVHQFWLKDTDTVYSATVAGGLSVSLISSVFHAFGSGLTAGGAPLQNRGLGFSLDPAHPGVVAPGKRPFHTIIPGLVRRDAPPSRPFAVFGVVGGPMQPQGQVQVLVGLIDVGRDAQKALDAPRARWLGGDLVALEPGLGEDHAAALTDAGFVVTPDPLLGEAAGCGQVVLCHDDGWLEGAADGRRDGVAFGR